MPVGGTCLRVAYFSRRRRKKNDYVSFPLLSFWQTASWAAINLSF